MKIPHYEEITAPMLKFLSDQKVHSYQEVLDYIINYFRLTEEQKNQLLPSGTGTVINKRVKWAKIYLKRGGLLDNSQKGQLKITQKGIEVANRNPDQIKITSHEKLPEPPKIKKIKEEKNTPKVNVTPKEIEKKVTPDLKKPDVNNNNVDKKELETLYKLYSITENIEKKEIDTLEKLDIIIENIKKKEIQTSSRLDNIIANIEKKEYQTGVKLDNLIENLEKKIIHASGKSENVNRELKNPTDTMGELDIFTNDLEKLDNISNNEKQIEIQPPNQLDNTNETIKKDEIQAPDELIQNEYKSIKANMGQELLDKLKKSTFQFFENIVIQLLSKMGYGKGEVINRSLDGRIDGFINPDRLGFDRIYFRANRSKDDEPITTPIISDFIGTLEINGVNKGVFITTSNFQKDFEKALQNINKIIILIDGNRLGELMIEYNIGVITENVYEIKKIDSDFFSSDQ
jgi:restriction system protein